MNRGHWGVNPEGLGLNQPNTTTISIVATLMNGDPIELDVFHIQRIRDMEVTSTFEKEKSDQTVAAKWTSIIPYNEYIAIRSRSQSYYELSIGAN